MSDEVFETMAAELKIKTVKPFFTWSRPRLFIFPKTDSMTSDNVMWFLNRLYLHYLLAFIQHKHLGA
jgi:hypothetical protein